MFCKKGSSHAACSPTRSSIDVLHSKRRLLFSAVQHAESSPAVGKDAMRTMKKTSIFPVTCFAGQCSAVMRERDLGNSAVEIRLCRGTLSCCGHKPATQACLVGTTSLQACDGALSKINKHLRPSSTRSAQLGAVYSSITLIHSSLLIFQARLHEVQRRCSVKSAHDARVHHSSRGRRL